MEIWQAVTLGLVEGITEYLPVSSTGHLILASSLMGLDTPEARLAINDFNIVVQGGAILAVAGLYWPRMVQMVKGLLGRDNAGFGLFVNLCIAFVPAAIVGFLAHDWIEAKLFHAGPVLAAILLGGLFMMVVEARYSGRLAPPRAHGGYKSIEEVTPLDALKIGALQCLSLWPGMSRSMMCIVGGYVVGLRPRAAAEFSFLLGLPTLTAACLYSLLKNLHNASKHGTPNLFETLGITAVVVGIAVATVSAALAIRWLVGFLAKYGLQAFAWYRIALFVVLTVLSLAGVVQIGAIPSENIDEGQDMPKAAALIDR